MRECESALHWAAVGNAPVVVLKAIATAGGPNFVTKVHIGHAMGVPIDCLLSRPLSDITPDVKEKVIAILAANPVAGAELSIQTAFNKIQRQVKRCLQIFPQTFPSSDGGPFAFLEEEEAEQCQEGAQIVWDVFVLLIKVAYYKTLDNLDSLPLLHALVDYSKPLFCWEHGLLRKRRGINGKAVQFAACLLPQELMLTDPTLDTGDLPLHLAISKKNPKGITPDHYDRYNSSNILAILKACPKAAHVTNNRGLLPLELALSADKSWDIVNDIFDASTDAVNDSNGCNIMHIMASTTRLWDYFEGFATIHHKLLHVKNHAGLLPMHCAINNGLMWNRGIEHLYNAFPEAITRPDGNGFYPFLLAALATEKRAFNQYNRDMHNRYYDIDNEIDVTFHLLRAWPDALKLGRR